MKSIPSIAALATIATLLSSCATIVKGSTQVVTIDSNVKDAKILLDGKEIGVTPFSGKIAKSKSKLTVSAPGYVTKEVALSKAIEPAFFGNIITGGTLGSITDFASGAAYSYAPSNYQVDLIAEGQSTESFRRESELRRFALVHYPDLLRDGAEGSSHAAALLALLGETPSEVQSQEWLKETLEASQGDRQAFAKLVSARSAGL